MKPMRHILEMTAAAAVILLSAAAIAGPPFTTSVTQTVRTLRQDQNGIRGDYLVSYSALSLRSRDWSLRASVSWLSWRNDGGAFNIPDDSGPGALYTTAGRRLWLGRLGHNASSTGWIRLRGKIPLQSEYNVSGTGEADWGAALFSSNRFGALMIMSEAGFMNLGEPTGIDYDALLSGSLSMSYRRFGARIFPIVGISAASPARSGDPAYSEWTAGLGAAPWRNISFSILYSQGTTSVSPEHGLAVGATWRL